eukprot:COSAG06_NODE_8149_length_2258_cov_3.583411_2_plen_207_part_00
MPWRPAAARYGLSVVVQHELSLGQYYVHDYFTMGALLAQVVVCSTDNCHGDACREQAEASREPTVRAQCTVVATVVGDELVIVDPAVRESNSLATFSNSWDGDVRLHPLRKVSDTQQLMCQMYRLPRGSSSSCSLPFGDPSYNAMTLMECKLISNDNGILSSSGVLTGLLTNDFADSTMTPVSQHQGSVCSITERYAVANCTVFSF